MKLFEPGKIGRLTLKNRLVMAAMGNRLTESDGRLSQRGIDYYVARARGGVGLIVTCNVRIRGIEQLPFTTLTDSLLADSRIYADRLNELAEGVHDYGAKVAVQVSPGTGRNAPLDIIRSGGVSASPVAAFADPTIMTRELTTAEVERLAKAYQVVGEVVCGAEIDAIEINAHGGYLVDQFMSTLWNKRTDKYGGDLDGRLRFLLEIIANIRKGAGASFPIIVKFPLTHYLEGGREIGEGLEIARKLEAAGVNALCIDAGCYETIYWLIPPSTQPPGCMVDLAEKVKKVVNIPVIAVGRLHYPELAESTLREGKADFIALGRGLLADPEWPNKVKAGRVDDICPCVGDNEGCRRRIHAGKAISCTVNAACGNEKAFTITSAEKKKTVLVVGGGPGGMEAARVAALRGHRVILCEKSSALGGNLIPASAPDGKQDYGTLINYLSNQIGKLVVDIKLSTETTPQMVQEMKPDAVVIATGGKPVVPGIRGVNKEKVITAVDLLLGKKEAGESVAVIGGGTTGCETALHLAGKGKRVTVVEMLDKVLTDMYSVNRAHLLKLLDAADVKMLTGTTVAEITDKGVGVAHKDGKKDTLLVDTIVLACGFQPNPELVEALRDSAPEVYSIGDCVSPRKLINAMREGFRIARLI